MRYILLALAFVFSVPVCAQEQAAPAQAQDTQPATDNISVFGRSFTLQPFQMEMPSQSWNEVKAYLPPELAVPPKKPMSNDQIFSKLDSMLETLNGKYEAGLARLVDAYMTRHPGEDRDEVEI